MAKKNNAWISYAILVVAIAALVLSGVAIHKSNMTGNAIFDFLKKKTTSYSAEDFGLLGAAYLSDGGDWSKLKGYESKYDGDGNLIYEIVEGILHAGNNYIIDHDGEGTTILRSLSKFGSSFASENFCSCTGGAYCDLNMGTCAKKDDGVYEWCEGTCESSGCSCTLVARINQPE